MTTGPGDPLVPVAGRHRIQPKIRTAASGDTGRNLDSVDGTRESYLLSLRALELAVGRVKEACRGDDIDAAAVEAHFALHAVYDLHEAYFQPRGIHGTEAKDKVLAATGGQAVGALSLARGKRTHELVTFLRRGGFSDRPHGMGPYGPGWIWKEHSWTDPKLQQRAAWYQNRVSRRLLWSPLDEAWMWFIAQCPQENG
jgi:hypothetical protein